MTSALFYVTAGAAVVTTLLVVVQPDPIHALLWLIVSLLAVATLFFLMGAHFAAALEVIIYAGAILVLFIFGVMMVNPGPESARRERLLMRPRAWIGPGLVSGALLAEVLWVLAKGQGGLAAVPASSAGSDPRAVGLALYGPYLLGVELASLLLLSGLVGAWHLGRRETRPHSAGKGD